MHEESSEQNSKMAHNKATQSGNAAYATLVYKVDNKHGEIDMGLHARLRLEANLKWPAHIFRAKCCKMLKRPGFLGGVYI